MYFTQVLVTVWSVIMQVHLGMTVYTRRQQGDSSLFFHIVGNNPDHHIVEIKIRMPRHILVCNGPWQIQDVIPVVIIDIRHGQGRHFAFHLGFQPENHIITVEIPTTGSILHSHNGK